VSINCLTLPATLIEAELFGHEKGAFTGAMHTRKGLFEVAEDGTIFLDEIGDMAPDLQAKLLDAIEEKRIRRLGSTLVRPVNVRVIASTNVDLETALGSTFRRDLYYRLSVIRVHIPPLRERKQDLPALCTHFLQRLAAGRDVRLPDDEISKLSSYDWPGNARELRNIIERALIVSKESLIRPSAFLGTPHRKTTAPAPRALFSDDRDFMPLEEVEKRHIQAALDRFSGSLPKTADALGISLSTLKRRIRSYESK
jgi:transcriptional regulator with PAS, ATPase and Fis domain